MTNDAIVNLRFTMIADVLPVMEDKKKMGKMINRASTQYGVSKQTIRRYLKLYLENGKEGLAPVSRPKPTVSNDFSRDISWGLSHFYYDPAKRSLKDAYRMLLEARYYKDGSLVEPYPSFWQFRYYYRTHNKKQTEMISRQGLSCYQRNERPLLGETVTQYANAVGVAMLDSTVCDIYLVNDAGQIVGRPILTACVDAYSGLCCGYSLGWEGGTYSLRNLMLNVIKDKQAHCKDFGIEIKKEDWNCDRLPAKMITDMGSEYAGENFSQLVELGVTITNLPPYRPDLKSKVEKFFDLIQNCYKPYLKNKGIIEPDYAERGVQDYRRQACLTLTDFEKIIVHAILFYNSKKLLKQFPFTETMLNAGVKPYASDIWNYGCSQAGANLIDVSSEQLMLTLLPRTTGKFTRKGLIVQKLRYKNSDFTEDYLTGGEVTVSYNPDNTNQVWLLSDGKYIAFHLIESRFADKTFAETDLFEQQTKALVKREEEASLLAEVELAHHILDIANTAAIVNQTEITNSRQAVRNIRQTRKKEAVRTHRNLIEKEVKLDA